MSEDIMPFDIQEENHSIIKVVGVGGGGGNAVNHMFRQGINDVDFVVCNTDAQVLEASPVPIKIQLGASLTEGRGAGNKPEQGRQAAIESIEDVMAILNKDTRMVFITAGLGGGTGTGAAPVIAKAAKEVGILTVGIVTLPFRFEGNKRVQQALEGLQEIHKNVDALLVINNEKLREIYGDLTISNAFAKADDILTVAVKGIAEIITVKGYVNVDFEDVKTVMKGSGVALMGSAMADGENRALKAIQDALSSPLLNSNDIIGAQNILLNFVSGTEELTMEEISTMNEYVQEASGNNANLIWGNCYDEAIGDKIGVTVIATGFRADVIPEIYAKSLRDKGEVTEQPKLNPADDIPLVVETTKETDNGMDGIIIIEETTLSNEPVPKKPEPVVPSQKDPVKEQNIQEQKSTFDPTTYREHLDEYENTPAYKRKGIKINPSESEINPSDNNDVSDYFLKRNQENNHYDIGRGNPYLNDNVD